MPKQNGTTRTRAEERNTESARQTRSTNWKGQTRGARRQTDNEVAEVNIHHGKQKLSEHSAHNRQMLKNTPSVNQGCF